MLQEGLVAYLAASTGVRALIGTPQTRIDKTNGIFPMLAPDGAGEPHLVLQQVSGSGTGTFDGKVVESPRWRISACSSNYRGVKLLAEAVKAAMFSCIGSMPAGSVVVQNAELVMDIDDQEALGSHGTLYKNHTDWEVLFVG